MRRSVTWLLVGILAGFLMSGAAVAAAYDVAANCAAVGLHFVFGGSEQAPPTASGNPAAFICDGTAYVPIRFVAQALGQTVGWEGTTNTITVSASATKVVPYQPTSFTATQTVSGSCWTSSVAAPRAGAYRCTAGNAIFDPCFVGTGTGTVDCPDPAADPDQQTGTVIQLTAALPAASTATPSPSSPWRFRLADGAVCGDMTGTIMPGHPYGCAPAPTAGTASASAIGTGGLYCAPPVESGTSGSYTVSCAPLSPERAANGAPQLATPATYPVVEMWT